MEDRGRLRRSGKGGFRLSPPHWLSALSVAPLSTFGQIWQAAIWAAKVAVIMCEQNPVEFAQVGRISAVFPNLRSINGCASWEIPGTFLRKLGRESENTGVCENCRFGKIDCDLRKLGKTAAIRANRLRKLGKTAGMFVVLEARPRAARPPDAILDLQSSSPAVATDRSSRN